MVMLAGVMLKWCEHAGVVALLPDSYILTASYPGDSTYAGASTNTLFVVDRLCLLEALRLIT